MVYVAGSAGPGICDSAVSQVSLMKAGLWGEAFVPGGAELRFLKTFPEGDIGI